MNDWEARARMAGLLYIEDFGVGYTRKRCGKGFRYIDEFGRLITCKKLKARIQGLVIPPAWRDVWICKDGDGHIQATGFDAAGRKQYIYHPKWHEASAKYKYGRLLSFARVLPTIRRRVQTDLKSDELNKKRVVAAVVRVLDKACLRIGNRQYLEANDSRGATTLTVEHIRREDREISFNFKGKSGKQIELKCADDLLAQVIEDCENSEGEFLFSYERADGEFVPVSSADVNAYLLEVSGEYITAKDFRTWRGSVIALKELAEMPDGLSKTAKKRFIANAVKQTSIALGNTAAVCRSSYIHSAILTHADQEMLRPVMQELNPKAVRRTGLNQHEIRLMAFLSYIEKLEDKETARTKSA